MIERIYQRSRGMAQMSRRLFAQVRDPGLRGLRAIAEYDPFVLLESKLADVAGRVEQMAQMEQGELRVHARAAGERIWPLETQGFRFNSFAADPGWTSPSLRPSSSLPMPAAAEPAQSEGPVAKSKTVENPLAGRQSKLPAFPQFAYGPSVREAREDLPSRRRQSPSSLSHSAEQQPAAKPQMVENSLPGSSNRSPAFRQFTYGDGDRENQWNSVAFPLQHKDRACGQDFLGEGKRAGVLPENTPDFEPAPKSRLVQTAGLIHLLKKNTAPSKITEVHSAAPPAIPQEVMDQQPAQVADRPAPALTVDAVLDELEDRLRFEYLRTYGSSGE